MTSLVDELDAFTENDSSDFGKYHKKYINHQAKKYLKHFLHSSMDEIRLENSEKYSNAILQISNSNPLIYFRKAVLRRELFSDIEYSLQRDHSAHTLHNYLLGWYIFSNSTYIKESFRKEIGNNLQKSLNNSQLIDFFGDIWPFASLTHDIGYILEGGLETYSTEVQSDKVERGAIILEDYFNHRIWSDLKIKSITEKEKLLKHADIEQPSFHTKTIASVASSINNIGDITILLNNVKEDLITNKHRIPPFLSSQFSCFDSFSLWGEFYNACGHRKMKRRMDNLRMAYEKYFWDGHPISGTRLIDHGVSSGLIILLADTFFFNFIFGLNWKLNNTNDNTIIREINSFKRCLFPPDKDAEARYWWLIVVWATAATAIHNMQQEPRPWPGCEIDTGKLKIYEDPLAYLGILVDILEEWDRYSVMRRTFFTDYSPVQSKDIILTANNDKIEIKYDNIERGEKVIKSLDTALHSWRKIIKIVK